MMRMQVADTGRELARHVELADSLFSRMKGLLGRQSLPDGTGLWIRPCNSVHTIGMRFPIDVVFLDKSQRVVIFYENLKPFRLTAVNLGTASVVELPAGKIAAVGLKVGDSINLL